MLQTSVSSSLFAVMFLVIITAKCSLKNGLLLILKCSVNWCFFLDQFKPFIIDFYTLINILMFSLMLKFLNNSKGLLLSGEVAVSAFALVKLIFKSMCRKVF